MSMIWKVLTRKKVIDPVSEEHSQLARVLNTFDLTALGVGSTLGVGVYVLAGHVALVAGPAVILSFLLAAIASVFAGLCYAEFGARAPRAGSAYIYSYVCVGEFVAFVIGWNLILEYVIGSASVARGLSAYLDSLINNTLQNAFREITPMDVPYLSHYFDFFAFGVSVLLATALAFGMKESSLVNNIFTILNLFVVGFVIIAGSFKADPANWSISPNATHPEDTDIGKGGFFPFGVEGMIKGAATCFYGFVGFDCIATTGEEVRNPKRAIPISIILSLFIIFLAYFGTSTVLTLMVPFHLQDPHAPIPSAFEHFGWEAARWIVSIGAIFGLCASLFGAMFPLPRIIYAMANDSLMFKFLGRVHSRFQTPVIGTLLAGLLTGLMAALFDLEQLVKMMSIGTLLAYTIVAASVLLLRYAREEENQQYMPVQTTSDSDDSESYTENKTYNNSDDQMTSEEQELLPYSAGSVLGQIFNFKRRGGPTRVSEMIVTVEVFLYCIFCILMGLCAIYLQDQIGNGETWAIVLVSIVVFLAAIVVISIATQPTSNKKLSFKVPLVPLIPAVSILMNIYLMLMLDTHTWIRFAVWMALGLPMYYFSVRPYTEAQNKNVSNKSSIDYDASTAHVKQNGKPNGLSNVVFVHDDEILPAQNDVEGSKKRSAPQPPNGIFDNEIPAEITRLDEMLDEAASAFDNSLDRKLSAGTVSNVSDLVSREENVVAVVHRVNVVTPANSFSSDKKPILSRHESQTNDLSDTETSPEVVVQSETQKQAPNVSNDPPLPNGDLLASPKNSSSEPSPIPTPPPSPSSPVLEKSEAPMQSPPPPPLPSPTLLAELALVRPTASNLQSVTLKPTKRRETVQEDHPSRPSAANLRSVTLRPTKRRETVQEDHKYDPGEDNLKVGSDKYKRFLENLSGKLQNMNVVPNYLPFIKQPSNNPAPVETIERIPNENIVEDSINKIDASEKLGSFISDPTRNKGILGNINNILNAPVDDDNEIQIVDETETAEGDKVEDSNRTDDDKLSSGTGGDSDFLDHKDRMQNVFRSMTLKRGDTQGEPAVESRHVKTLGPSFFADDKSKHRQAMGEIFKSIELRGKDSEKQNDGD